MQRSGSVPNRSCWKRCRLRTWIKPESRSKKLERDLQTRRQEQDVLKEETILVIQGKSALDRNMLADLVAENKAAVAQAHEALKMAKIELQEVETSIQKAKQTCDDLFTWANVYEEADFGQRQAILHQFIKEVRVGRDYDVEIILNVSLDEFEEFKAHAWFPEDEKRVKWSVNKHPKTCPAARMPASS